VIETGNSLWSIFSCGDFFFEFFCAFSRSFVMWFFDGLVGAFLFKETREVVLQADKMGLYGFGGSCV